MLVDFLFGVALYLVLRTAVTGFYSVSASQRALKTRFGRAVRIGTATTLDDAVGAKLRASEKERYTYPQVAVIQPGGPYFKLPWEKIHKVSVATNTTSIGFDPENSSANRSGALLEAVTKDQLNTGLTGQLRYRVSERNLYAYLFGVKNPIAHVMGFFISILRQRIATFEAPAMAVGDDDSGLQASAGISINDLRKNLRAINEHMETECEASAARYGIELDATLITGIDPPPEVDSALAAINTAHNHVSAELSVAQANADQTIVQSKRAVEIETLRAHSEVEPLRHTANQLRELKASGPGALTAYLRNVRLGLYAKAKQVVMEMK